MYFIILFDYIHMASQGLKNTQFKPLSLMQSSLFSNRYAPLEAVLDFIVKTAT